MGLADRDYMRSPSAQRGRATRLNAAPTDGVIWEEKADNSPAANHLPWRRRMVALALWLTAGTAVFTFLWAIACAMIGAQWHGQGTTFTPKTTRGNLHTGGVIMQHAESKSSSADLLKSVTLADMDLADSFRTQSFHLMQAHPIAAAHLVLAAASIAPTCAAEHDVADQFSFVIVDFAQQLGVLHRQAVKRRAQ